MIVCTYGIVLYFCAVHSIVEPRYQRTYSPFLWYYDSDIPKKFHLENSVAYFPSSLSLFFTFCSSFCRIRSLFFTLSTLSCPYHSLFSLFLRYFIFFSDDDYESTEGVNVYKLSRSEYFWAMFNAGSISECWEILKDGKEISRAHNMFYCHLIS